ncbi:MAG: BREX system serine/threonine kinase PglW [Magnetococcales bacterium]|nr:BREX system serine/threonine kinase PglW [Magnetococcales bacterium]
MKNFWTEITPSQFPWEQEALEFIRQRLPDHEPYRAWSNFEFIADDGSINEVDLLVLTPKGFFLVEIKSRPGRLTGNAGTWIWVHEGREYVLDNPLILANRKAKKLIALLRRQQAMKNERSPFLEPLIFCSAEALHCELDQHARTGVWLRDREPEAARPGSPGEAARPGRPGILQALTKPPIGSEGRFQNIDRPMGRRISRAMEEAGIRPSNKSRKVGQYQLGTLLAEEDIYQEWEAQHVALEKTRRRVRIYPVASREKLAREAIIRAAQREFQILEGIEHPGILRAENYLEHELGPALIFEHYPGSVRLDHFLIRQGKSLSLDQRLHLARQIGEALAYAHQKKLIHRALNPQSILVLEPDSPQSRIKIFNWQTARRDIEASTSRGYTATLHVQDLVENAGLVYLAPEVHADPSASGEELDVFSLGAITFHLFAGSPPATTLYELVDKLKEHGGLQISSVLDGAGTKLQELILYATHRDASLRIDSMRDFLALLDDVEEELTRPNDGSFQGNPTEAKAGDLLPGGWLVKKRLGSGATSVAFLVDKEGRQRVLKLASGYDQNDRIREEADVLKAIRHSCIVDLEGEEEIGGLRGLLLQYASKGTMADRIRQEGRIHAELLERFGGDLLQAVNHLEEHGISHRDIKPANLGLVEAGSKGKLHLILFDFSLARVSAENIRAGTPPYLDPFLIDSSRRRWDLHAERFAAAMTLYEMATGVLPRWGDGKSDPALLDCAVTIDGELFEPSLREGLSRFFAKALARRRCERFDTCDEMLKSFYQLFRDVERAEQRSGTGAEGAWDRLPETLEWSTPITGLPFSDRALSALERLDLRTVGDLLAIHIYRLSRMRGVGRQTQKELTQAHRLLAHRFPDHHRTAPLRPKALAEELLVPEAEVQSIDLLVRQLIPAPARGGSEVEPRALELHLGLKNPVELPLAAALAAWSGQAEIAQAVGVTRGRISQILAKARIRWAKRIPSLTALRNEIVDLLNGVGGVMTLREMGDAVLALRGSSQMEPERSRTAQAVTRAALEVERGMQSPRWIERRSVGQVFLALDEDGRGQERADHALRLGRAADDLAGQDPLPTPARVMETLREERLPQDLAPLSVTRLLKLAVSASRGAALSSRSEIYPRGLSAARALKLAQGALLGASELTIAQVRERVMGRYPEAEPLPDRPMLDTLLEEAGCRFEWGPGKMEEDEWRYKAIRSDLTTVHQTTVTRLSRLSSEDGAVISAGGFPELPPEVADARAFQKRLEKAAREGTFLALRVPPKKAEAMARRLESRFGFTVMSLDVLILEALREVAREKRIMRWEVILEADGDPPESRNWGNLMALVKLAIPKVEARIKAESGTVLLTDPGLLARYGRMDLISRLQEQTLRPEGLFGLWMLIPSDDQNAGPCINGAAVPVMTPGQWARIPDGWIKGLHA